jgi:hypothetical protein
LGETKMRICKPLNLDLAAAEKRCFELVSKAEAQFDDGELPFPFPWPRGTPDVWSSEDILVARIFEGLEDANNTRDMLRMDGIDDWINRWQQAGLSGSVRWRRIYEEWKAQRDDSTLPLWESADEEFFGVLEEMWEERLDAWGHAIPSEVIQRTRGDAPVSEFAIDVVVESPRGSTVESYTITRIRGGLLLGSVKTPETHVWESPWGWGGYEPVPVFLAPSDFPVLQAAAMLLDIVTFGPGWLDGFGGSYFSSSASTEDVYRVLLSLQEAVGQASWDLSPDELRETVVAQIGFDGLEQLRE